MFRNSFRLAVASFGVVIAYSAVVAVALLANPVFDALIRLCR